MTNINTAGGAIKVDELGKTLMHEHLIVAFPGWESDTRIPAPDLRELKASCLDKIAELKAAGFSTILDPCPNDLGRDPEFMADVAVLAGFNIIFATGLYNERLGASSYWSLMFEADVDADKRLAEMFIKELTDGVRDGGIKPAVIKVGTSFRPFSDYEKTVFRAAAIASGVTGAPIMTHSDGLRGEEQLAYLMKRGVAPHRIIVGHCCDNPNHDYHMKIVDAGAYIGFDRFGEQVTQQDDVRIESLLKLLGKGVQAQLIISHDSVWCWKGRGVTPGLFNISEHYGMHFTRAILPRLIAAGVDEGTIDDILTVNPRRYFGGQRITSPTRIVASLTGT